MIKQKIFRRFHIWLQASRLPAIFFIALPLALGFLSEPIENLHFSSLYLFVLVLYAFFLEFFIVFANDYADEKTDALNQSWTKFSGGSRVLAEKLLSKKELKKASFLMGTCVFLCSIFFAIHQGKLSLFFLGQSGIFILWAYSYPPLKLSYRGGGEILQVLGLSWVLPIYSRLISGKIIDQNFIFFLFLLSFSHFACAISTALPDETSDRISEKKTLVVSLKKDISVILIILSQALSYMGFITFLLITKSFTYSLYLLLIFLIFTSCGFYAHKKNRKELSVFCFIFLTLNFLASKIIFQVLKH
ncbi:MAG: 1,4-dihydroxy-2-naphthoate prenyltransferase [Zetaproteobacteria bacterium]|nr:1,4-dihydroxy-2-naphthoate prenyltransferase [Pseudobdellovibrionaceae bacterium]